MTQLFNIASEINHMVDKGETLVSGSSVHERLSKVLSNIKDRPRYTVRTGSGEYFYDVLKYEIWKANQDFFKLTLEHGGLILLRISLVDFIEKQQPSKF